MHKPLLRRPALILAALAFGAADAAQAHVHWSVGIGVGVPYVAAPAWGDGWYGPAWYGPGWYGYAPLPPVVVQAPPVQVAPPQPLGAAPPSFWYRCHDPAGYYPYVANCPGGWIPVPAQPPQR